MFVWFLDSQQVAVLFQRLSKRVQLEGNTVVCEVYGLTTGGCVVLLIVEERGSQEEQARRKYENQPELLSAGCYVG